MSRDEGFLDRWSRRKRVGDEEALAEAQPQAEPPAEELSEEEWLAKLDLPDPDTLKEGDDFAAFMRTGVPEFLKKRALRKLWLTNPALANLDGLLEYGEDYTDAAMVPEVLATAYKVGKGLIKDALEDDEAAPEETDGINQDMAAAPVADPAGATPEETMEAHAEDVPKDNVNTTPEDLELEEEPAFRPRRMAFRYD